MDTTIPPLFRVLAQPDAPAVLELLELLKYEYIGLFGEPDPNPEGGIERAFGPYGATVLLSTSEGHPVALCGITLDSRGHEAILRRMFTRWEWRRHGLGRTLLREAENQARRLGAGTLKLETGVEMPAAIALYHSEGYAAVQPFGFYAASPNSVFLGKEIL